MTNNFEHVFRAYLPSLGASLFFFLILCPALQGSLFSYYWHLKVLGIFWIQFLCQNMIYGTSLVVQWIGFFLPAQGTQVRSLVGDLVRCGASKPVCASQLQGLRAASTEAHWPGAWLHHREAAAGRSRGISTRSSPDSPRPEKAAQQQRPRQENTDSKEHEWQIISVGLWFVF